MIEISDDLADKVTTYLYFATPKPGRRDVLADYSGAMLVDTSQASDSAAFPILDAKQVVATLAKSNAVVSDGYVVEDGAGFSIVHAKIGRSSLAEMKPARAGVPVVPHWLADLHRTRVDASGEYETSASRLGLFGDRWHSVLGGHWRVPETEQYDLAFALNAIASAPTWRALNWTVEVGFSGKPSITIPSSPEHAMEVYRLRDVPEGATRRQALRNWVRAYRRADGNPVKEHLRGAERFVWNGLRCTISPPTINRSNYMALRDAVTQHAEAK